ncbi:MAG: hypothetical protein VYE67_06945 [Planctomycetota bacterium]|nr:hypothetical protein [Planctomycetota bacterium]
MEQQQAPFRSPVDQRTPKTGEACQGEFRPNPRCSEVPQQKYREGYFLAYVLFIRCFSQLAGYLTLRFKKREKRQTKLCSFIDGRLTT